MFDRTARESIQRSDEKDINNKDINNNSTNQENNNQNLPSISEKRIFIHKPSDFLKNKYTFFGNLSNNRDLLSMDSRKTYHSHKFNMKDFKKQMKQGNQILGSIIRDETKILPNLLKSYEINLNNRENNKNFERHNESMNLHSSKNINNINNMYRINNSSKTFNNSNADIFSYNNNLKMINQKSERLVNLNFLVSSPKKIKNNYNYSNKNHYQIHGVGSNYGNKNSSSSRNTNYYQKNYNGNRGNNHYSIDASPRMSNPNIYQY